MLMIGISQQMSTELFRRTQANWNQNININIEPQRRYLQNLSSNKTWL